MTLNYQHKRIGDKVEWLTPPRILKPLGRFNLDPAAPCPPRWQDTADEHYDCTQNGLLLPWRGRVWLNPPFGNDAHQWLAKMRMHGNGILLIPARTETKMFFEHVWPCAHGILFIRGRVNFHHADGTPGKVALNAPVCLVAYGRENAEVLARSDLGKFIPLSPRKHLDVGLFS